MSDDIEWGDPPPPNFGPGSTGVWARRLAPFKERPGTWGRYPQRVWRGLPDHIREGRVAGVNPQEWEVTSRNNDGSYCDLWVRYIGPEDGEA
jgi:hypothetical protein